MIAVLYDVHGNLPALEAVLADARACGVESFVLGGDYALFGAWPAETVARLRELPQATWIRGNTEREVAARGATAPEPGIAAAAAACWEALGEQLADELSCLPDTARSGATLFCHASPLSDERSFLPEPHEGDERLLAGAAAAQVVFGHTHLQFRRPGPGGVELINPGSVGLPFDGDSRAGWALMGAGDALELRRVAYDHAASAAAVVERFGSTEWTERSARRLRTARP